MQSVEFRWKCYFFLKQNKALYSSNSTLWIRYALLQKLHAILKIPTMCIFSVHTFVYGKSDCRFRNIYSIFFFISTMTKFQKKILPRWAFIEGTDTEFEVMTVTQLTPKWLRIGCGDLWECVVSQSWPKTRYKCLTYHGTTQLTWNYEVIHWSFNTGSKSVPCPHGTSVRFN